MLGDLIDRGALGEKAARSHPHTPPPHPAIDRIAALAAVAMLAAPLAIAPPAGATDGEQTSKQREPTPVVREQLTVTDSRLPDQPTLRRLVPAHITVLDRDEIAARAAVNPQELLALEAGVVLYDATGSDLQKTLDLRGFTGGGVKVFLDGAPLNEPRNNSLALELVTPLALERVEINRGSGSALAGGGSEAGVINLFTGGGHRDGDNAGGRLGLTVGSFDRLESSVAGWGRAGETELFAVTSFYDSDGYRDNGGADLGRFGAKLGGSLRGGELRLSLLSGDGEFGNPGALRREELAADRRQAPFNRLDFSNERLTQATLNYDRLIGSSLSFRGNLFARDRDRESLTTGRSAPAFGGFFLDSGTRLAGAAAQLESAGDAHELAAGLDWLDGDTDALGFSTPPGQPGTVDRAAPGSDNRTTRRTAAVYIQDRWRASERLTVSLGARWDEDRVVYREALPDPSNLDRRTYSELSLRGGLTWAIAPALSLYASYGEAFLPPTVEELFSFPLFGSNPELEPQDSRSLELGLRRFAGRHHLQAALFRVDSRDEIVFDPGSLQGRFGANVNAGETRREGLEVVYRAGLRDGLRWFATATLLQARFRGGANAGSDAPLVPEHRLSLGAELALHRAVTLRADALRVGEQALDNDDANARPPLAAYTVVNARLVWDPRAGAAGGRRSAPILYAGVENLFDEEYATRGIFAFDFSTFTNEVFLTPAPDRRFVAGVEWGL